MAIVDLVSKPTETVVQAASNNVQWIKQGVEFIGALNNLLTTINNNPLMAKFTGGGSSEVVNSDSSAKIQKVQMRQEVDSGRSPEVPQSKEPFNDVEMMAFLQTPEGMNKIVEALDTVSAVVGDVKLSELKSTITQLLPSNSKPGLTEVKGEVEIKEPEEKNKR